MTTDAADADGAVLLEPVRIQVITLAADVLGKLPAEEVPAPLRTFARFAPTKRVRLGGAAIAAALDGDDTFRERVAQTLVDSTPGLVAAVGEGSSTAAADPLDVAAVAYLTRPEGWQDTLAAANRRWLAERGDGAAPEELERLRDEVAELRNRARTERARIRSAVAESTRASETELANLRRELRERARELRESRAALAATETLLAEARDELARSEAAHDSEVRRLRARVTELERSAETSRRETRTDRDVDTARLWLLVETLVQAASGVRRELSLPAPALRPADAVGADAGDAPRGLARRSADDAAALDRLLAMPNVHLVVDGYNVTKTGYGELSLADQRSRLVTALAGLHAQTGAEITIAFDGGVRPPVQPAVPRGLRVLFSSGEIADDLIRRLVAAEPPGRPVVVVSSDGEVVRDTARDGAWTVPSAVLLARLG